MLFIVRGKTNNTDSVLRIEAESAKKAEAIGWSRGLFVTEVACADRSSAIPGRLARMTRLAYRLWRHVPANPFFCFGQPVSSAQSAALMMLGVATWALLLHTTGLAPV